MSFKKGAKLELLKSIRDEKDSLFGCFSKTLTKQIKNEKWKEIHKKAQSLGIVSYEKDYTYTRDTVWQNIRKTTMVSSVVINILPCLIIDISYSSTIIIIQL